MKYPQLMRIPSEVSEWLEEQLEQRGIDAIVYTRYVLSLLLYSNTGSSDQLVTWQDMRRRSNSARNTSAEEAERQRRLAAVNCLVAASEHPQHMESLVDELCDRLKRVNSDTEATGTIPDITAHAPATNTATTTTSRHDLARRYYAAFPALQGVHEAADNCSDIILVQQEKWPLKRHGKEMNLSTPPSKHRYTNGGGGNSGKRKETKRLDYASAAMKKRQMVFQRPPGIDRNWFITSRLEDWHSHSTSSPFTNNSSKDTTSNTISNESNVDYMVNDSLALDIVRDILDDSSDIYTQPTNYCYSSSTDNFYQQLSFNNNYNNKYITNGTNIITSIWSSSEDDMSMGWVVDKGGMCLLDKQEADGIEEEDGIITIDAIDGFLDVGCRWSEAVNYESQMLVLRSLEILNHSQEFSGFTEVMPKSDKAKSFNSLSNIFTSPPATLQTIDDLAATSDDPEEDFLHSAATHFRPIPSPMCRSNHHHSQLPKPQYADGTTFYVSCTPDTLTYEHSEDGATMWLDLGEDGGRVEYMNVVGREKDSSGLELKFRVGCRGNDKACQTMVDEDVVEIVEEVCKDGGGVEEFFFPGDLELLMDEEVEDVDNDEYVRADDNCIMEELFGKFIETEKCDKCSSNATTSYLSPTNITGSFLSTSATTNNQLKSIWDAGELCVACLRLNAHSSGNASIGNDIVGLDIGKRKENNQQQEELRYDVTKDGEQLLSDLSSIQNRYMLDEERMSASQGFYYGTDIRNKVLQLNSKHYDYPSDGNTADCLDQQENHHQHHPMLHSASFSFASRLQEDCLIKMATMPTLRSVTL